MSIPGRLPHRSSNDDIQCSQLPFHNLSDEGEKRSFRVLTDALAAGQILVARLYRPDDSFDSEAAFRILDVQDYEPRPVLEVDSLGASRDHIDTTVTVPEDDRDTMLHLCRNRGDCGRLEHHAA